MPIWAKLLAFVLFVSGIGAIHALQHGVSRDFGLGLSLGLALGGVLTALAADWCTRGRE